MPLITWDKDFSVNVVEIDNQHQQLVSMLNHLHSAMSEGKGNATLSPILNGLVDYAGMHFKTEEKYFARFKYPFTVSHVKEHKDFVATVSKFKEDFTNGKVGLSFEVMNFLKDWLQKHIKTSDKKYGPYFNENGLF